MVGPERLKALRRSVLRQRRIRRLRAGGVWIVGPSVDIDDASCVEPGARIAHHTSLRSSSLGRYTSVGRFSKVAFADIASFCSISWDCTIGAVAHPLDRVTSHAFAYIPEIGGFVSERHQDITRLSLGHDVWIGANCVVMPGVEVGTGAAVAATAVVTRNIEPYAIVAGVPGKQIGQRFEDNTIERLLRLAWWSWSHESLTRAAPLFREPVTPDLLDELEGLRP